MTLIARLVSRNGATTLVGYDFNSSPERLVQQGDVDCYIVSTDEDGFSPLGASKQFFANELAIDEEEIGRLAHWNRFDNPQISLIGLPSRRPKSQLRGVVLAAGETSRCYEQFGIAFLGRPHRDFYYNVAYESIAYSAIVLGAKKIAMTHLSGSGHFHEDIATCVAEALAHFCDNHDNPEIHSFLFTGCCIDPNHFRGIRRLNAEGDITEHRNIHTQTEQREGYEVVSLDWR